MDASMHSRRQPAEELPARGELPRDLAQQDADYIALIAQRFPEPLNDEARQRALELYLSLAANFEQLPGEKAGDFGKRLRKAFWNMEKAARDFDRAIPLDYWHAKAVVVAADAILDRLPTRRQAAALKQHIPQRRRAVRGLNGKICGSISHAKWQVREKTEEIRYLGRHLGTVLHRINRALESIAPLLPSAIPPLGDALGAATARPANPVALTVPPAIVTYTALAEWLGDRPA